VVRGIVRSAMQLFTTGTSPRNVSLVAITLVDPTNQKQRNKKVMYLDACNFWFKELAVSIHVRLSGAKGVFL